MKKILVISMVCFVVLCKVEAIEKPSPLTELQLLKDKNIKLQCEILRLKDKNIQLQCEILRLKAKQPEYADKKSQQAFKLHIKNLTTYNKQIMRYNSYIIKIRTSIAYWEKQYKKSKDQKYKALCQERIKNHKKLIVKFKARQENIKKRLTKIEIQKYINNKVEK